MRASLHEPSVFHAMLALSSLHKKVSIGTLVPGPETDPDRLDLFSLRHYTKAIHDISSLGECFKRPGKWPLDFGNRRHGEQVSLAQL